MKLTVADDNDWDGILDTLNAWKSIGCWSANVELKLRIDKTPKPSGVSLPSDAYIKIDSDDDADYLAARNTDDAATSKGQSGSAKKAKAGSSATQAKLEKEEMYQSIDKKNKNNIERICKENSCPRDSCKNHGLPCIRIGDKHMRVYALELAEWSEKINKGFASIFHPHPALMKTLERRAEKLEDETGSKKKGKVSTQNGKKHKDESSESSGSPKRPRKRSRHDYDRDRAQDPVYQMQSVLLMNALANQSNLTLRPPQHLVPQPQEPASSPPPALDDEDVPLQEYIQFLTRREPGKADQWTAVRETLEKEDIDFDLLPDYSVTELAAFGIAGGPAKRLLKYRKKFLKSKAKKSKKAISSSSEDA
jgi:hypothetical protein